MFNLHVASISSDDELPFTVSDNLRSALFWGQGTASVVINNSEDRLVATCRKARE